MNMDWRKIRDTGSPGKLQPNRFDWIRRRLRHIYVTSLDARLCRIELPRKPHHHSHPPKIYQEGKHFLLHILLILFFYHPIRCETEMQNSPGSAHLNFTMGGLVLVGGAMGYLRKGSMISLVAGVTFGGLLIGSGVLITNGESFKGHGLAAGCTGLMTVAMGQRFLSTGKFMPAGMVASLGAIGLAYNVKKAIEWMPEKNGE